MCTKSISYLKRCWATVDLSALEFNLKQIKKWLPAHTNIMGVVKADAYGHGDRAVARVLLENGVDFLAVSNIEEAVALRGGDLQGEPLITDKGTLPEILILGYTPLDQLLDLVENGICQTVFSIDYAKALNAACEEIGARLKIHIKIDTGMNRLGILQSEGVTATEAIREIVALPYLEVTGIFSHLSSADSLCALDAEYTSLQVRRFSQLREQLDSIGVAIPTWHIQNSAGIAFLTEDKGYDYARAGIVLYGLQPGAEPLPFEVKPVMSIKTVVSHIKEIEQGEAVSYGRRYVSDRKITVATLPIGYADGYFRALSNKADVLIKGKRARIIGNICMDQMMVDITGIDGVAQGDEVTVVGSEGNEAIGFTELAELAGTISYELICAVNKRVPRVYL